MDIHFQSSFYYTSKSRVDLFLFSIMKRCFPILGKSSLIFSFNHWWNELHIQFLFILNVNKQSQANFFFMRISQITEMGPKSWKIFRSLAGEKVYKIPLSTHFCSSPYMIQSIYFHWWVMFQNISSCGWFRHMNTFEVTANLEFLDWTRSIYQEPRSSSPSLTEMF